MDSRGRRVALAAALVAIATAGAGILTNYATNEVPDWARRPSIVWPALGLAIAVIVVLTIYVGRHQADGASNLVLDDIRVDEDLCAWEASGTDLYLYPERPPYMQFVEVNFIIVHYLKLTAELQQVFALSLTCTKKQLASGPLSRVPEADAYMALESAEFYAAMVLMNRLGDEYLDTDESVFDVRGDSFIKFQPRSDFYRYDLTKVRAVRSLISDLWPGAISTARSDQQRLLSIFHRIFMRTDDLVLEFLVTNRGESTVVVSRLLVEVGEVWTLPMAGPSARPIPITAKYRFRIAFEMKTNEFVLDPPISIGSERSARLQVCFYGIRTDMPGNHGSVQFLIPTDGGKLTSDTYTLLC